MKAHTPGPWQHELTDFCTPSVGHPEHGIDDSLILAGAAEHFRPIARVERVYNWGRDIEMERANARLIAAAPDLLAELKWAMDTLQEFGVARNTADQAIAKAEGRS